MATPGASGNTPTGRRNASRPPALKVDQERFPALSRHPALERALRIRQAMLQGRPRGEAVALAQQAMGERAPHMGSLPTGGRRATRPVKKSRA